MANSIRFRRAVVLCFLAILLAGLLSGCGWRTRETESARAPTYILVFTDGQSVQDSSLRLPRDVETLLEGVTAGTPRRVIVIYE